MNNTLNINNYKNIYLVVVVDVETVEKQEKVLIILNFWEIIVVKKFSYLVINLINLFLKLKFCTFLINF